MKKSFLIILPAAMILGGCGGSGTSVATNMEKAQESVSETVDMQKETTQKETTEVETTVPPKEVKELFVEEFDELLSGLPVLAAKPKYLAQDEQYKSLYLDMLNAMIQNNMDAGTKDAVLAFVARDSNYLSVKLVDNTDFLGGDYLAEVNYNDTNLVGGSISGRDSGSSINEFCKVDTLKPIILSFETFDSNKWKNPYADSLCQAYEGKKYSDDIKIEVEMQDVTSVKSEIPSGTGVENASAEELEVPLAEQPVSVSSTKYVIQGERYKSLYPDMLQAVIQNNSEEDTRDAVVAYVGWGANGLFVRIKGHLSYGDSTYVTEVLSENINLVPDNSYSDSQGYAINKDCGVDTFKAVVVSYTTSEKRTWKNPDYKASCDLCGGKRLAQRRGQDRLS